MKPHQLPTLIPAGSTNPASGPSTPRTDLHIPPSPQVFQALHNAFPGIDAAQLVKDLDGFFQHRQKYIIAGSTALHLHSVFENQNPANSDTSVQLNPSNDLDLIVSCNIFPMLKTDDPQALASFNLKRPLPDKSQILEWSLPGGRKLKIDIIQSNEDVAKGLSGNYSNLGGMNVCNKTALLKAMEQRYSDPGEVKNAGGIEAVTEKKNRVFTHFAYRPA